MLIWEFCLIVCVSNAMTIFASYSHMKSQSRVIFRISSSIFISFSTSFSALIARLSYTTVCAFSAFSIQSFSESSLLLLATGQHLQQQQHLATNTSTTLSQGSSEWAQRGRKSHERSTAGRHPGFRFCSMFMIMMTISITSRGAPTPTKTFQPASDRLKTKSGKTKKQETM